MPRSAQVLIMLVHSSEVGKLLPVNRWSNTAGNRESSSALLTFRVLLWGNKLGAKPGWLGVLCYVAAHCRPAIPLNPRGCSHAVIRWCLYHHSVEAGGEGGQMARGARATQLWHLLWRTLTPPPGLEWWSEKRGAAKKKKKKRGGGSFVGPSCG